MKKRIQQKMDELLLKVPAGVSIYPTDALVVTGPLTPEQQTEVAASAKPFPVIFQSGRAFVIHGKGPGGTPGLA